MSTVPIDSNLQVAPQNPWAKMLTRGGCTPVNTVRLRALGIGRRAGFAVERWVPAVASICGYNSSALRADLGSGLWAHGRCGRGAAGDGVCHGDWSTAALRALYGDLDDRGWGPLGPSKLLINGSTNAISIAVLSALLAVPEDERVSATILLELIVGVTQTDILFFRLGDLSRFIAHAVIVGLRVRAAASAS